MTHSIPEKQLHKLLDEVRLADEEYKRAEATYVAAAEAKARAQQVKSNAHNAARPHLQNIKGLVIYDNFAWKATATLVTHEKIGLDLTTRQESLLPAINKAA